MEKLAEDAKVFGNSVNYIEGWKSPQKGSASKSLSVKSEPKLNNLLQAKNSADKRIEMQELALPNAKVKFRDDLNRVIEVVSYKSFNVMKDEEEEDCCESFCNLI